MQKLPNFVLGLLFLGFLSLAVVQGRYVDHLRESDMFYRWVISSANQVRLFGRLIDGGRLTVDIDGEGQVQLDIEPRNKSDKPKAESATV